MSYKVMAFYKNAILEKAHSFEETLVIATKQHLIQAMGLSQRTYGECKLTWA